MLKPSIESAATQAQSLGGLADVPVVAGHRFLDEESLDFLEAHVFDARAAFSGHPEAQFAGANDAAFGHQDTALDGMIQLTDVTGPWVLDERVQRGRLEVGDRLPVTPRVNPQEMRGEQRNIL